MDLPTKVEVLRFLSKQINIPNECLCFENGNFHVATGLADSNCARLLVIYTSEDCNECAVSHLDDLGPFYSFAQNDNRFKVEVFMTPKEEDFEFISEMLILRSFKHPVFIDKEGVIETQLPANPFFRIILLDKDNKVRFIGNPMLNKKAIIKFKNKLESL